MKIDGCPGVLNGAACGHCDGTQFAVIVVIKGPVGAVSQRNRNQRDIMDCWGSSLSHIHARIIGIGLVERRLDRNFRRAQFDLLRDPIGILIVVNGR